ncbi:MAG: class I SAM-dependent methyltransferase [Phycisphaerales bacterium JB059]
MPTPTSNSAIESKPTPPPARDALTTPELDRLRARRERVYAEGSVRMASGEAFEIFPAGIREWPGLWLRDAIVREGAQRTIETGFGLGLSALFMIEGAIEAAHRAGRPAHARHTAIDPGQRDEFDSAGLLNIESAGASGRLELIEEDSLLALPRLIDAGRRFDLAFIDGQHNFDATLIDAVYLLRLLRPGGLLVIDDQWLAPVRSATDFVVRNLGVSVERPDVPSAAKRFAVLRAPERPVERSWDHFVPFWTGEGEGTPTAG